jgi:hypothetical protein
MTWHARLTRFGSAHMVCVQDSPDSCGIACLMMVDFRIKHGEGFRAASFLSAVPILGSHVGQTLSRKALDAAARCEAEVWRAYELAMEREYSGHGVMAGDMPAILGELGLGAWQRRQVPPAAFGDAARIAVSDGAPAIAQVLWPGGGGLIPSGHFVVLDGFHDDTACVLDPWDGEVHLVDMPSGEPVAYTPLDPPPRHGEGHGYPVGQVGRFGGLLVYRE